ncbi:O-antigen ligase family protein [Francisella sp. 19X1-34]|uniref:O-antigen ligase family protein n=1 Tax=Francisella sp. 19X1-34 TaxID=3087177 RepID=UPI002E35BFA0|nr:O-antigen ligase family protein [Francisella sp. 19X1-34]MED7788139.1 O-antigen ligase family protein [Francisella sp. 19X1-34]
MILDNSLKFAKFYNYVNNILIILGVVFIFTKINVLGIFTVGILVNTIVLALFNYKQVIDIVFKDYKRVILFLIYPVFLYIMNIVHGDDKSLLFEIWAILLILPLTTVCLRELYKVKLNYLYYAFILAGLILTVRVIIYLFLNQSCRFYYITPYNTIHSGLLLAIYCVICVYLFISFLNIKKYMQCLLLFILFIVSLVSLLAVASKGPIIAFFIMLLILIILRLNIKKCFIVLFFLAIIFLSGYFIINKYAQHKFEIDRFNQVVNIEQQYDSKADTSTGIRLQLYKVGVKSFIQSPIVGLSYADITKLEDKMIKEGEIKPFVKTYFHFHDDLLNSLGHYGILGGIGIIIFWIMLFRFYPRSNYIDEKININVKYIMFIIFGTFILSSFTDAYFFGSTRPAMILVFVCSIVYSMKFDTNQKLYNEDKL